MTTKLKLLTLFLLCVLYSYGHELDGIVSDNNNKPIFGVSILNTTNNKYSYTDKDGYYRVPHVKEGDTLKFSHIGFNEKIIVLKSIEKKLNVSLDPSLTYLNEIVLQKKIDALTPISKVDIELNPVNSSQDVLQKVPGLFIGQHAGGGKAEQIFLRGFDIDHGTDINITVDDLPVNMVSHAHGQGYADLHFLIPETLDKLEFGKGPYYASQGNFNTAGYVNFKTKEKLDESLIKLEHGMFNSNRLLGVFNLLNKNKQSSYIASEYISTDGPFESPQNFSRINLMGKYSANVSPKDKIGITASYFTSKWDASGQIPQRAVDNGSINRFGSIDDTEGGKTSRTNVSFKYDKEINENSFIKNHLYYSNYNFELYSNFTFFLKDSINGDQIRQKENRNIFGLNSEYNKYLKTDNYDGFLKIGIKFRNDQSFDNELSHTANRSETLSNQQLGNIYESNFGTYIDVVFNFDHWTFNPGLRLDYFNFQYNNLLTSEYKTESQDKAIVSPKLNILFNPNNKTQYYLKLGKGFHSNDTRVVVAEDGEEILPSAYGSDLGIIWRPTPKIEINAAIWLLYLEQEFVYVGDEGIVEPSGETFRQGLDLSLRYQLKDWLRVNFDANYTKARALNEPKGENYIPLAPNFTMLFGVEIDHPSNIFGGFNVRHINDRPANEDNSIVAEGYTIANFNIGYKWKKFDIGCQIQNLFNSEWNETQFATTSRLQHETDPVEEIHFTPGTSFFAKIVLGYRF